MPPRLGSFSDSSAISLNSSARLNTVYNRNLDADLAKIQAGKGADSFRVADVAIQHVWPLMTILQDIKREILPESPHGTKMEGVRTILTMCQRTMGFKIDSNNGREQLFRDEVPCQFMDEAGQLLAEAHNSVINGMDEEEWTMALKTQFEEETRTYQDWITDLIRESWPLGLFPGLECAWARVQAALPPHERQNLPRRGRDPGSWYWEKYKRSPLRLSGYRLTASESEASC